MKKLDFFRTQTQADRKSKQESTEESNEAVVEVGTEPVFVREQVS